MFFFLQQWRYRGRLVLMREGQTDGWLGSWTDGRMVGGASLMNKCLTFPLLARVDLLLHHPIEYKHTPFIHFPPIPPSVPLCLCLSVDPLSGILAGRNPPSFVLPPTPPTKHTYVYAHTRSLTIKRVHASTQTHLSRLWKPPHSRHRVS